MPRVGSSTITSLQCVTAHASEQSNCTNQTVCVKNAAVGEKTCFEACSWRCNGGKTHNFRELAVWRELLNTLGQALSEVFTLFFLDRVVCEVVLSRNGRGQHHQHQQSCSPTRQSHFYDPGKQGGADRLSAGDRPWLFSYSQVLRTVSVPSHVRLRGFEGEGSNVPRKWRRAECRLAQRG